jgi:acyl-CoA thioester hydrolase
MSFVHTERVRFGDLDAMRHLNNVVFLRYFETARIAYLRELVPAHDPAHPETDDFGLIFAECHINYRSPVYFDEAVDVHCSIGMVRRSSFRVEFEMRVAGRLAAEGYGVLVGFDYVNQQAAQLPESLRERLEREADGEDTTSGGTEGASAGAS